MNRFVLRFLVAAGLGTFCLPFLVHPCGARPGIVVQGGLTISKFDMSSERSDPFDFLESMKSGGGGVGFTYPLGNDFALQPELDYVVKGFSFGETIVTDQFVGVGGTVESLHVVDYLEVPILLRWTVPTSGDFHPVLGAGPYVGFALQERFRNTGDVPAPEGTDEFDKLDIGLETALGFDVGAGPGSWLLEGRYAIGLENIANTGSVQTRAFSILTGYRF